MKHTFTLIASALTMGAGQLSAQVSASLPEAGLLIVTPSYSFQTADGFFIGANKAGLPADLEQWSAFIGLEYGISQRFALDGLIGWSEAEFAPAGNIDGIADSRIGLRYALAIEGEDWSGPSLTLRGGAIIAGDYEEGFINSPGDGASGWEAQLLVQKSLFGSLGFYGDVGFRQRQDDVPDDVFGSAGLYLGLGNWTLNAGWRFNDAQSGGDIGAPGFGSTFGFPQVQEDVHRIEAALGYTDNGGRTYSVFAAHTFDGKNTPQADIIGVSISIPFGGGSTPPPAMTISHSGK